MKQYLHTIMRSLCIMVMLCGISTSAWAQNFSEGEGSQESPWVITQDTWEEFASNYGSSTEYYFQLGEDIVLSEVSSTLDITSDYLDMNSCSITVGSDSYDLSFPSTFNPLFSSDLEDNVTYYFGVSSYSDLQNISSNYDAISDKSNVNFSVTSSFVIDSAPTETLNMPSSFSINDDDITVGEESYPVSFPTDTFYPVFDDSGLESYVKYYFTAESNTWDYFVDYYNSNSPSNVYLVMTESFTLESSSQTSLSISDDNFIDNGYKISFAEGTDPFDVFSDSDMNEAYVDGGASGYDIKDYESWKAFYADLDAGSISDGTTINITGSFAIEEDSYLPSSSIPSTLNVEFAEGCTITVGTNENPLETPSSDSFNTLFEDTNAEAYVTYYFSVTSDDDLSNADDIASSNSNTDLHFILTQSIDYDDDSFPDSYYSNLSPSNFDFGECSITVASNEFPSSSDISAYKVFSEDALDSKVSYNFTISDEDNLINFFDSWKDLKSNSTVTIGSEIIVEDDEDNLLSKFTTYNSGTQKDESTPITFPNISFADGAKIILGSKDYPTYYYSIGIVKVFEDDVLQDNVQYNIGIGSDWDLSEINKNYETYEENFDVQYMLSESFYLNTLPTASYKFTSEKFDFNDYTFTVDNSGSPLDMPSNFVPVFSDVTLNQEVIYKLIVGTQAGMEQYLNNSECFDAEDEITLNFNTTKAANAWYDYDLSNYTTFGSYTISYDGSDPIFMLLSDKCTSEPFDDTNVEYLYTPSYKLVDAMFKNIVTKPENRGTYFDESSSIYISEVAEFAGHGTEDEPYLIYNYEMLKALVNLVNEQGEDYTSDMYIKLMSDINVQGNERLTGVDGSITLEGYDSATLQFTNAFKGHFNGDNHSIGGLTRPLFSSLNGAEIKNLDIVDCNMSTPALATSATGSTVTMSYVSGVSNGLIPASGVTATNCYAWNTSTKAYKDYSLAEEKKVEDISGTHKILKDNCYELATDVYSDCTLFIPTSNDFYTYSSTPLNISDNYISYINWADNFDWIESPCKSNVALLHNVLYNDFWSKNKQSTLEGGYGGVEVLSHLYSWYIVDKVNFTVPSDPFRVKNIYYSRNNTSTTSPAPDGLNTVYLPFAWNPATDLYYTNNGVEERITDATVHILADKLNESEGVYSFNDNAYYKDYSMEKSLLFFDPANTTAENLERYNDFAKVSNALPTLLNIPTGKSGWYIKRTELANYGIKIADDRTETINGENVTYPNLYDRYWEDPDAVDNTGDYDESQQKKGRSFMEIGRLGTEWSDGHDSYYESYTRTIHYTCEDNSSSISGCDNQKQIYKTDADKTVCITDNGYTSADYYIYKANANGDIAVDGDVKILTIYQAESIIDGSQRSLIIYQLDGNGDKALDENSNEISIQTSENDQIFLDSEGYPVKIILADGNVEINLTRESDKTTGEVVYGSGTLHDNVLVEISSDYPHYFDTSSSDRIVVDNEGYPKKIILNYSSDPVEIEINRVGSSITGTVISGNYNFLKEGNKVVIYDNSSFYPLAFYVCGGHTEDKDCTWSGPDFPGRAYHLGTFKTIGKGESDITFGAGTYTKSSYVYSCYKLNSAGTGFAKVTATSTVQPFRTFIAIAPGPNPNASTEAKALKLGFCGIYDNTEVDNTPTEIDGVPTEGIKLMTTAQSRVYSIDGRYVGQYGNKKLAPGMYIMNGKKFVVK